VPDSTHLDLTLWRGRPR